MSITPLPSAPAVTDTTSEFNTKAFNWVAALDPFTTEANALLETCEDAAVTASAAIALVGAEAWVSGTTYAIGDSVYSPIDMQTYRRKTNGGGTTDPSADSTNWEKIAFNAQSATQAEMEAGTETAIRAVSPLRVKQAIEALTPPPVIRTKVWTAITSTGSYTVPSGVTSIRAYAFGGGGNRSSTADYGGGGGGGCAFGDIAVTAGQTVSITISSGVATVAYGGTTMLTANKGNNGSGATGGAGGTATKHASVTNGGAYTGGSGGNTYGGGGSSGSPLGNGYAGGPNTGGGGGAGGVGGSSSGGGGGAGGAGSSYAGGGSGGPASGNFGGDSRYIDNQFSDPLMQGLMSPGAAGGGNAASGTAAGPGGGGSSSTNGSNYPYKGGNGGAFGGGAAASYYSQLGGTGGFGGGGGAGGTGGAGGYGGGGGGGTSGGIGGAAIVLIYA